MKSAALKNASPLSAFLMAGAGVGAFNTLHSPAVAAASAAATRFLCWRIMVEGLFGANEKAGFGPLFC